MTDQIILEYINSTIASRSYELDSFIANNEEAKKGLIELIHKKTLSTEQLRVVIRKALPYIHEEDYLPTLQFLLSQNDLPVGILFEVIQKIGWLGKQAIDTSPLLLDFLNNNPFLRGISAIALIEIGYNDIESLLPHLIFVLENDLSYIQRKNAARILHNYYNENQDVLSKLINTMEKDPDFRVRQIIAYYLRDKNEEKSKQALLKLSTFDKHPLVRSVAKSSLEKIG